MRSSAASMPEVAFLLDANMPRSTRLVFEERNLHVTDVRDIGLGAASDDVIIAFALQNNLIVVTRDLDFGAVLRHPAHPGAIILCLPSATKATAVNSHLALFLDAVDIKRISGAIFVVELGRFRRRPLR